MSIYPFPPRPCTRCGHAEEKHRPWCIDGTAFRRPNAHWRINQTSGWRQCSCKEFAPPATTLSHLEEEAALPSKSCETGKNVECHESGSGDPAGGRDEF